MQTQDTHIFDIKKSRIDESVRGSGGNDTLRNSASLNPTNTANACDNIDCSVLTGTGGISAVGSSITDTIFDRRACPRNSRACTRSRVMSAGRLNQTLKIITGT